MRHALKIAIKSVLAHDRRTFKHQIASVFNIFFYIQLKI